MRHWLTVLIVGLGLWAADAPPPKQPVAFSHKQHAGDLKMPCKNCHTNPEPGELMTFAAESKCMACHQTIKTESEDIQKLARFAQEKKRLPWVRVYQLPTYVFWSHKTHLGTGATCTDCHGAVAEKTLMFKEKDISMGACMECHRQKKASMDCTYCHDKAN